MLLEKSTRRGPKPRKQIARRTPLPRSTSKLKRGPAPARRTRVRAMGASVVQKLIRQADRLFSAIVLRTKVCEICHRRRATDTAHHISRTFKAVRWTLANASAACRKCHTAYTLEPSAWKEWVELKIGAPAAEELRWTAQRGAQVTEPYMRDVIERLRAA